MRGVSGPADQVVEKKVGHPGLRAEGDPGELSRLLTRLRLQLRRHPLEEPRAVQEEETLHPTGVLRRVTDGNRPAQRVADKDRPPHPQRIQKPGEIADEHREAHALPGGRGTAEAREVRREHPSSAGQRGHHACPRLGRVAEAVQQHDRLPYRRRRIRRGLEVAHAEAVDLGLPLGRPREAQPNARECPQRRQRAQVERGAPREPHEHRSGDEARGDQTGKGDASGGRIRSHSHGSSGSLTKGLYLPAGGSNHAPSPLAGIGVDSGAWRMVSTGRWSGSATRRSGGGTS